MRLRDLGESAWAIGVDSPIQRKPPRTTGELQSLAQLGPGLLTWRFRPQQEIA